MYVFATLLSQPYLVDRGYSVESLGFVFALITGISGAISSLSHIMEKNLKKRVSFYVILITFSLVLLSMGLMNSLLVIVPVILFYIVNNHKNIIIDKYVNDAINSESRASVLSVQSFVNNVCISLLFVFIGYLVDSYGIDYVLIGMGILIGLVCAPYAFLVRRAGSKG